jgi:hypothetical protein
MLKGLTVAGVPVLVAAPGVSGAERLPTVLWCHGFRADALSHAARVATPRSPSASMRLAARCR